VQSIKNNREIRQWTVSTQQLGLKCLDTIQAYLAYQQFTKYLLFF